jgi:hypothetical protein
MVPVRCKIWVLTQDTLSIAWSDERRIIPKLIAVLVLLHVDVTVAEDHEQA